MHAHGWHRDLFPTTGPLAYVRMAGLTATKGNTAPPTDADIAQWRDKGYVSLVGTHHAYPDACKLPEAVRLSKEGMAAMVSASHATPEAQQQLRDDIRKFKSALTQPSEALWEWLAGQLDTMPVPGAAERYPRMRLPVLSLALLDPNDDPALEQAKRLASQAASDMLSLSAGSIKPKKQAVLDAYSLKPPTALKGYAIEDMQDLYFERAARYLET